MQLNISDTKEWWCCYAFDGTSRHVGMSLRATMGLIVGVIYEMKIEGRFFKKSTLQYISCRCEG